jgi:hypothetical protein
VRYLAVYGIVCAVLAAWVVAVCFFLRWWIDGREARWVKKTWGRR